MEPGSGCGRCQSSADAVSAVDLPAALVDIGRRWTEFLSTVADHPGGMDSLHQRPRLDRWSAMEYGCHVRDLTAATARNLELVLLVDCPPLQPIDATTMLVTGSYHAQDPHAVTQDLRYAVQELAGLIQRHSEAALCRVGAEAGRFRSGLVLCRWLLHELRHHLVDAQDAAPLSTV